MCIRDRNRLGLDEISRDRKRLGVYLDSQSGLELIVKQVRRSVDGNTWNELTFVINQGYRLGIGPSFRIVNEGTFRTWLKGFSFYQDIELDELSIDMWLTIKGKPPGWTRKALKKVHRDLKFLLELPTPTPYPKSDGRTVKVQYTTTGKRFNEELLGRYINLSLIHI